MGLAMGRELSDRERAKVLSKNRNFVSDSSQGNLGLADQAAGQVLPRNQGSSQEEGVGEEGGRMDDEREAHWTANMRGREVIRG